ncbi:hypothetical protein F9K33_08995 [bacterium]|nr:MAG: hypothetical protein F9K33_08995 [bacterium]
MEKENNPHPTTKIEFQVQKDDEIIGKKWTNEKTGRNKSLDSQIIISYFFIFLAQYFQITGFSL